MRFALRQIDLFERDVRLRLPFRFGIVTLTQAPQAFVRTRIRLENGREAEGAAAELLAPKWFDKNPALSNEQNFDQLRLSLALARDAYLAWGMNSAFGHFRAHYEPRMAHAAADGLYQESVGTWRHRRRCGSRQVGSRPLPTMMCTVR